MSDDVSKPLSKTDFISAIAGKTGVTKLEVNTVLDGLINVVREQLSKNGPGSISILGLAKITVVDKPAKPAAVKPNPFKPGETMEVKAKAATRIVKIRPLKSLKDMV
jgi:nucleoid DNA-binding protein